jgi:hypothetical protein
MEYSAAGLYLRGELGVWRVSVPPHWADGGRMKRRAAPGAELGPSSLHPLIRQLRRGICSELDTRCTW